MVRRPSETHHRFSHDHNCICAQEKTKALEAKEKARGGRGGHWEKKKATEDMTEDELFEENVEAALKAPDDEEKEEEEGLVYDSSDDD